jgi:hypothetical protein
MNQEETSGRHDPWLRAAALAGVATLPLVLIGLTLSDLSGSGGLNPGSPDSQMLQVIVEYRGLLLITASLFAAASVAMLMFLGPPWARLP